MRDEHADALGYSPSRPKPAAVARLSLNGDATAGLLRRDGLDLSLEWEGVVRFDLTAIRDTRDGEPLVVLQGTTPPAPGREIVPKLLYEGESTLVYADGDSGKSLSGAWLAVAVTSRAPLPHGLTPTRAVPVAFLDWETSAETLDHRIGLLATGFGIPPPAIVYKRMARPLVDEIGPLAADLARRGVGVVILDSHMFAVGGSEGVGVHEPITRYYTALRLFGPHVATLTFSHVTNADARSGTPARPYGGAFAFNGPRLIWEAKRDRDVDEATALVLRCRKANNLPRVPGPFGLRFEPGPDRITVRALDLADVAPAALGGASFPYQLRRALARGSRSVEDLATELGVHAETIRRTLNRQRRTGRVGYFVPIEGSKPQLWALAADRTL